MCNIVPSESLRSRSLYEKDTHLQIKNRLQVSGNNGLSETKSVMCESYIKSNIDYRLKGSTYYNLIYYEMR